MQLLKVDKHWFLNSWYTICSWQNIFSLSFTTVTKRYEVIIAKIICNFNNFNNTTLAVAETAANFEHTWFIYTLKLLHSIHY